MLLSEPADGGVDALVREAVVHLRAAILLLDRAQKGEAAIYVSHAFDALGVPAPLPPDSDLAS